MGGPGAARARQRPSPKDAHWSLGPSLPPQRPSRHPTLPPVSSLESDARVAVEAANAAFYAAFRAGDMRLMAAIWGTGRHVQVIHPAAGCITGREAVLESWRLVLGGGGGGLEVDVADVRV